MKIKILFFISFEFEKNGPPEIIFFDLFSYNRNKFSEDFENLRIKLCERYISSDTQSTCNVFFVKTRPGSARKKTLVARFTNGVSPSKRLSHLARRRRTFSSANLQHFTEKKPFMVTVK